MRRVKGRGGEGRGREGRGEEGLPRLEITSGYALAAYEALYLSLIAVCNCFCVITDPANTNKKTPMFCSFACLGFNGTFSTNRLYRVNSYNPGASTWQTPMKT